MDGAGAAASGGGSKKRLKVAASFGRSEFLCSACEKEEAQGGDPKGTRSGAPRACDGPRVYRFHGGAAEWTGCPRLALGYREAEWLAAYDRSGERLSLSDLAHAPLLLVDVFDALDELQAQATAHARSVKAQAEHGNPAVLR